MKGRSFPPYTGKRPVHIHATCDAMTELFCCHYDSPRDCMPVYLVSVCTAGTCTCNARTHLHIWQHTCFVLWLMLATLEQFNTAGQSDKCKKLNPRTAAEGCNTVFIYTGRFIPCCMEALRAKARFYRPVSTSAADHATSNWHSSRSEVRHNYSMWQDREGITPQLPVGYVMQALLKCVATLSLQGVFQSTANQLIWYGTHVPWCIELSGVKLHWSIVICSQTLKACAITAL